MPRRCPRLATLRATIKRVRRHTMTAPRIAALCDGVEHLVAEEVDGALVECDVWRGSTRSRGCRSPATATRARPTSTGYPPERIHLVPGLVEETIPREAPERVALLRMDTDWYASTRHQLEHLYPRLSLGGVLIVDDYGHYAGAKRAVEEYFAEHGPWPLLTRSTTPGGSR
jgi:hypothetical protein